MNNVQEYLFGHQKKRKTVSNLTHNEQRAGRSFSDRYSFVPSLPTSSLGRPGPLMGAGDNQVTTVSRSSGWLDQVLREVESATPGKQVAMGGISGWASGYVFGKVGRIAAVALGGSIILIQIAHYKGLVQINWQNIERRFETTTRHFNQEMNDNLPNLLEEVGEFARRHALLFGSFFAGFLIGLAT